MHDREVSSTCVCDCQASWFQNSLAMRVALNYYILYAGDDDETARVTSVLLLHRTPSAIDGWD